MSRKTDETDELRQRFLETRKRLADNVRELGRELEQDLAQTVDRASSRIELGVERVTQQVASTVAHTVDSVKERLDVRSAVRANPWRNLGISVATGFGAALLLTRRRTPPAIALPAPAPRAVPARTTTFSLFGSVVTPMLVQLARAGAGQILENLLETSLRHAHESLEARSPRYAKAAEAVRHRTTGPREDLH